MKKKFLLITALLILALPLSACGGGMTESAPSASSAASSESAAPAAEAPEADSAANGVLPEAAPETAYHTEEAADSEYYDGGDMAERGYSASGESYLTIDENQAMSTAAESMLTFSLKVDTAAYSNVQRYIESGVLPPRDAVRTEELINYFSYDEKLKFDEDSPFAIYTEVGPSPFDANKRMAFIRVATRDIPKEDLPSCNLTFLIDTSGSMYSHDKLPLLKEAFSMLADTLGEDDIVSLVTYAGSSSVMLDSVSGTNKDAIKTAIDSLEASGSTAGANGIQTVYALAEKNRIPGGNNRVILATDGDFNVGISNLDELSELIGEKRDSGVYLSVLGFGTGNIRDDIMETLSRDGNGNYSYINSSDTAKKVLVDELAANLFTVANDVKAQVEFNPGNVKSYRLVGYENRSLANEDFADDTKDAGEIGAGADVVVMFEMELAGAESAEGLKYASSGERAEGGFANELFEVRIRYKNPGESESKLLLRPITVDDIAKRTSSDYNFACSVAAFGHLLRGSQYSGDVTIADVTSMAKSNLGKDPEGYRVDYYALLKRYQDLI